MDKKFLNKKLMQILDEQATRTYKDKSTSLSYDFITNKVLKAIKWSETLNLKETSEYLFLKTRYAERLGYYYDQVIKSVSAEKVIDLSSSEYNDFWLVLGKLEIDKYFIEYKCLCIDSNNLFGFLALLKNKINEQVYMNRFKLKSIEMIEYKKGLVNEVK